MKKETKDALKMDMKARDSVKALSTNPDWKVIENFLTKKYTEATNRLKIAEDKDVVKNQAIIAVIDSLIEELGITIQLGNQAEKLFQQYKEKEKEILKYA